MRKLIAVGVLIGGLLAGAGTAMAQQGGNADPLSLAASGVLIPFITGGPAGNVALVEVASPVGSELNLHMIFFNATCDRVKSIGLPLTTNDIGFVDVYDPVTGAGVPTSNVNGLVAIADTPASGIGTGTDLIPLQNPIHSKVYVFGAVDGRSRVVEPIILDTAEFPGTPHFWSPLRTAATFYAPLETASVKTVLTLICPRETIQHATLVSANASTLAGVFPEVTVQGTFFPPVSTTFGGTTNAFNPAKTTLSGRVYDTEENLLKDIQVDCDCVTEVSVNTIDPIYSVSTITDPFTHVVTIVAALGTYTELQVLSNVRGVFTGYRSVSTVGSGANNFWARFSNGNKLSIVGTLTNAR